LVVEVEGVMKLKEEMESEILDVGGFYRGELFAEVIL